MKNIILFLLFSSLLILHSCNYFESDNPTGVSRININVADLKPLADSLAYVGWIITSTDSAIKIFEKNADQSGSIQHSEEAYVFAALHRAQQFRITVEKAGLPDSLASMGGLVVLAGRFTLGSASLTLGEGVSSVPAFSGEYILDTPTDTTNLVNKSGVWFVTNIAGVDGPEAGLNLPLLYGGWTYEAWVEVNGQLLSCGRFEDPSAADDFSGYSGPSGGYSFPGEDFVANPPAGLSFPLDLSGAKIYVTLELDITKDLVNPYSIRLLEANVPSDAQSKTVYQLQQPAFTSPYGVAVIEVDMVE